MKILLLLQTYFIVCFSINAETNTNYQTFNHLIIEKHTRNFQNQVINVNGHIIIKNGGRLILENSVLNIISSFDEEHILTISGNSLLKAVDSKIQGKGYQTAIIAEPDAFQKSPEIYLKNTVVTLHAGIRPYGDTKITAIDSKIEEIQVHDTVNVSIVGSSEIYPVFFFEGTTGNLKGLVTDVPVSRLIKIKNGWQISFTNTVMDGYQIDLTENAKVKISNCEGITTSIHTDGNLGAAEIVVNNVTTSVKTSGTINNLGPSFNYADSELDLFNIYLRGNDKVKIDGGIVNEANTEDQSQLTLVNNQLEYNLIQAYDQSLIFINNAEITGEEETQPSLTAMGEGRINVENSKCDRLLAQAIEDGKIYFSHCRNLSQDNLSTQDNGQIFINNKLFKQ